MSPCTRLTDSEVKSKLFFGRAKQSFLAGLSSCWTDPYYHSTVDGFERDLRHGCVWWKSLGISKKQYGTLFVCVCEKIIKSFLDREESGEFQNRSLRKSIGDVRIVAHARASRRNVILLYAHDGFIIQTIIISNRLRLINIHITRYSI